MPESNAPTKPSRTVKPHRILVPILIALGALCILISTISVWVRDAALDTENWTDQSGQLLESEAVREVLSLYIVDQAYSAGDVEARVEAALPEQFKPLAGPASSQLQGAAYEVASQALAQPRVQELWRTANEAVHGQLIAFVEGETERVQLEGDTVVLNLDQIVANVAGRIGAGEEAVATVQERVEPVVIIQADELETVQNIVAAIKVLSFWPFILGLALWAGAVYLARGRRRETIRALALSLILIGIVLLAVRRIVGNRVIDSLVEAESVKAAAMDVWAIFSSLLAESAVAGVVVGAIALVAVWLAGPSRRATAVRHWLAPTFRDQPILVHGILAAVILLLLIWGPVGTPRRLLSLVILTALAFAGLEVLRRQTVREFPTAVRGDAMSLRAAFSRLPGRAQADTGEGLAESKVERLERLAALRERGALSEEEYQAEKALLLT